MYEGVLKFLKILLEQVLEEKFKKLSHLLYNSIKKNKILRDKFNQGGKQCVQ